MALLRISRDAHLDLDDIWLCVARDNMEAADDLTDSITHEYERLAAFPFLGRLRDELRPGLRSWAHGSYVIFYTGSNELVEIVRVLHGARDLPPLFE